MNALGPLLPILGTWNTNGRVVGDGVTVVGTDTYRRLPGKSWIAHDVDVVMGTDHDVAHELIGGEHSSGGWAMYAFDSAAQPTLMRLTLQDDTTLLLEGDGVRSGLDLHAGTGRMRAEWERVDDGAWAPWMTLTFDRIV